MDELATPIVEITKKMIYAIKIELQNRNCENYTKKKRRRYKKKKE